MCVLSPSTPSPPSSLSDCPSSTVRPLRVEKSTRIAPASTLALPLTAGQIWFGKLLAGILLLTGSTLLIVLPSVLAGSRLGLLGQGLQQTFVLTPVATILVLFLAHGFGTALRSRTPWIAYDVTGLVLTMFLVNLSLREFARYYSTGRLQGCLVWILVVISGWLLGGYLQHSRGRADIQRGHRWLTLVAWSVTILASLGLLGRALLDARWNF